MMKKNKRNCFKLCLCLSASLIAKDALAESIRYNYKPSSMFSGISSVVSMAGGASWEKAGETQMISFTSDIVKNYVATKKSHAFANFNLFVGLQNRINNSLIGQLGLLGGVTSNGRLSGMVWDDADPLFDNYSYTYKVQHSFAGVQGKILLDTGLVVFPWVSGSVGAGFNRAQNFMYTPLIEEAVAPPNFAAKTFTTFSYSIGAGLQYQCNNHWQVGIAYDFSDWGKSQLGPAQGQTTNNGLSLGHFYSNGVLVNVTFVS